ncbi:hypothetical protein DQ04_00901160 [Trypanosoma grayi]|uniref:hypothetical protein n=1 Tax=Trypanosoma grayi TaxID=71804 RepID=UPI0004F44343|nr:hypothetical protein DQ04_00901160 [Trypanosoma grayi]KEG13614.1 hypothetical protein DQ04_00901160 [Trypanosoma grayi]
MSWFAPRWATLEQALVSAGTHSSTNTTPDVCRPALSHPLLSLPGWRSGRQIEPPWRVAHHSVQAGSAHGHVESGLCAGRRRRCRHVSPPLTAQPRTDVGGDYIRLPMAHRRMRRPRFCSPSWASTFSVSLSCFLWVVIAWAPAPSVSSPVRKAAATPGPPSAYQHQRRT